MSKKDNRLVKSCDEFKGVLTWTFNPQEGEELEPLEFDMSPVWEDLHKLHPLAAKAMMHGFKQKISDAGAMARDTETGKADNTARVEKMRRMAEALAKGDWELQRTGGGAGPGVLAKACAEVLNKDLDVVRDWLKDKSAAEKLALRKHPKIAAVVARLESEAVQSIDADELLAGLE